MSSPSWGWCRGAPGYSLEQLAAHSARAEVPGADREPREPGPTCVVSSDLLGRVRNELRETEQIPHGSHFPLLPAPFQVLLPDPAHPALHLFRQCLIALSRVLMTRPPP